jgi:hypothetical protein
MKPPAFPNVVQSSSVTDGLRQRLVQSQNADGGWPYYAGKQSRVEPTCWAVLALGGARTSPEPEADHGLAFLRGLARTDGLLAENPGIAPNLALNGLAVVALGPNPADAVARRLVAGIDGVKGVKIETENDPRHDSTLVGWPWIDTTFSWVEPTAWCLLAVKKARRHNIPTDRSRETEAERMMSNRGCESGGWNYGTAYSLGRYLHAYVPTTAVGLLAMQDRRDQAVVRKAIDFLVANRLKEVSGMALSLTTLALDVHGRPTADVKQRLIDQAGRTGFLSNLQSAAMALYALTSEQHANAAFRLL